MLLHLFLNNIKMIVTSLQSIDFKLTLGAALRWSQSHRKLFFTLTMACNLVAEYVWQTLVAHVLTRSPQELAQVCKWKRNFSKHFFNLSSRGTTQQKALFNYIQIENYSSYFHSHIEGEITYCCFSDKKKTVVGT